MESELSQTGAEVQCQMQEHLALLKIKVRLEAEITAYFHLLENGEHFCVGAFWIAATPCRPSRRLPPAGSRMATWCLRPMTLKF